jgi:hypothetical protein
MVFFFLIVSYIIGIEIAGQSHLCRLEFQSIDQLRARLAAFAEVLAAVPRVTAQIDVCPICRRPGPPPDLRDLFVTLW